MTTDKKEKVLPKTQKVYRHYNGTWDDIEEVENPDTSSWKLTYDRAFTQDGELLYEIELDVTGNEVQKQLNTYNERNKIVRHELYNEGQLVETIVFEYNQQGLLASEFREFEEGYPLRTLYTYDDQGRMIEKRTEDADGEQEKRETFAYHPDWKDKVVKHEIYDEEDTLTQEEETEYEQPLDVVVTKEHKITDHTINQFRKTIYYSAKDREDNIAHVTYNEKEKAIEIFRIFYDEKGREQEERSESILPSENYEVLYSYDDSDRIIHQEHRQGDRILSKHNRRYNESGLPNFHGFRSPNRGMHVDFVEYTYFN